MKKQARSNPIAKILIAIISIVLIIGLVLCCVMFIRNKQWNDLSKDVPKVTYMKKIPFKPEDLTDITDTPAGVALLDKLGSGTTTVSIPANSKVLIPFQTYCLDPNYNAPDADNPSLFVYQKPDMPMATEIYSYAMEHEETEDGNLQSLFWHLSSVDQYKFEDFSDNDQAFLLSLRKDAKSIINNYKYNSDLNVTNFVFDGSVSGKVVPQKIGDTQLYAKVIDSQSYYSTDLEVYNPTSSAQNFQLVRSDGKRLVFVPKNWVKTVVVTLPEVAQKKTLLSTVFSKVYASGDTVEMQVISGINYEIVDGVIKTKWNGYAEVRIPGKGIRYLYPHESFSPADAKAFSIWDALDEFLNRRPDRDSKFQIKTPTITTGRRG